MTPHPVLNYDILLEIAAASSWSDSAGLLNACRYLHSEGPKALLRKTIDLSAQDQLLHFLAFLRGSLDDVRFKSVRSICLVFPGLKEVASSELSSVLPRLCNLSSLYVANSEYLRDDLLSALGALTSLRTLSLRGAGQHTVKMLQSSQSKLVSIYISFPPKNDEDAFFDRYITQQDDWPQYHPVILLAHSRSTLRELECDRWHTHPEVTPDPGIVYPEMRRLTMGSASYPLTVSFIRAYPNLTYLSIYTGESDDRPCSARERQRYDTHRNKNLLAQAPPGCSWQELKETSGALVDLYLLGLTCLIERMELNLSHPDYRYMVEPVLSYSQPRHLVLRGWPGQLEFPANVFAVLQGQGGTRLESFSLDARLEETDREVDVAAIMVREPYDSHPFRI